MSSIGATTLNAYGQPIGPALPDWQPPSRPTCNVIEGRFTRLEPLQPGHHGADLFAALNAANDGPEWTYLPYGPFRDLPDYLTWIETICCGQDPSFFAIIDRVTNQVAGHASWLRITPESGSIEVGHIHYARRFQRSSTVTEAMYLMMREVFSSGYRRYEWKCDALNAPSRAAAQRLGFSYEGTFRQASVYKNRSRDTAWYAMTDGDWPFQRQAFESWLDPSNFDDRGQQHMRLSDLHIREVLVRR